MIGRIALCCSVLLVVGCSVIPKTVAIPGVSETDPTPPSPPTVAEAVTYNTLAEMAWYAFIPGMAATIAGLWFPPIQRIGMTLLGIGAALAATPLLLAEAQEPVRIALWFGLGVGVLWLLFKVILCAQVKWRQHQIARQVMSGAGDKQKHLGAIAAMDRLVNPQIDRQYRKGEKEIPLLPQPPETPTW